MLFNSYVFIFLFLPVTALVFFLVGASGYRRLALGWLVACSFFYYGWWNPEYLLLIGASIGVNYCIGYSLTLRHTVWRWWRLAFGVTFNLALLGYFKYVDFLLDSFNTLFGSQHGLWHIVLPIGLSFYTFQQIAYLVDAYRGLTKECSLLDYCLFITFFPQLIAGPIVHHKEMMPQFTHRKHYRANRRDLSIGFTLFVFGLAKKVLIADTMAESAAPVFGAAAGGLTPSFSDAWLAALAYTFQIYFDFSGYSDMAIGLARMFGVKLPANFNSPYKAASIVEFWHRWHITLSRFLRDYLYIPLGGNRTGKTRRYVNLMLTMLIGGLWHGAGWQFVVWGGLHGAYLTINHAWSATVGRAWSDSLLKRACMTLLTFLAVVAAWVFFRSADLAAAGRMFAGMADFSGALSGGSAGATLKFSETAPCCAILLYWVWAMPNTQQVMGRWMPTLEYTKRFANPQIATLAPAWLQWYPNVRWSFWIAVLFTASVLAMTRMSEFIYYQF